LNGFADFTGDCLPDRVVLVPKSHVHSDTTDLLKDPGVLNGKFIEPPSKLVCQGPGVANAHLHVCLLLEDLVKSYVRGKKGVNAGHVLKAPQGNKEEDIVTQALSLSRMRAFRAGEHRLDWVVLR